MISRTSKLLKYSLPFAIILGAGLSLSPALAQDGSPGTGLESCRLLSEPALRLECYDRILGTTPEFSAPVSSPAAPSVSVPTPPSVTQDVIPRTEVTAPAPSKNINPLSQSVEDFENTKAQNSSKNKIKSVSSEIVRADTFDYKKLRIYLKNGQVWEQTDSVQIAAPRISKNRTPFAKITKASFGSHLLRINGKSRAIKVQRVR